MADSIAKILLVDDDVKSLMAMEALLEGPGRTICKARSAHEALRHLLRTDFALILLDVRMPELDGFETAALIRQRERSRYTPIIFLSAVDTLESDVLKGASSGAVDYLFKPVVTEVLKSKVGVFIDLFHLNERLKQQALWQSEERFRLLVDSIQDYAIMMLDSDGRITSWNTGAEQIKGYKQEEIIGKHFDCFYTPEDRENGLPAQVLDHTVKEGRYEQEGWRVKKDGSKFWENVILTALKDEYGNLIGFSKVTRDLTERKRTEEALRLAEENLRAVVATAPVILFALDPEGKFTLLEGQALHRLLQDPNQAYNLTASEVFQKLPHVHYSIQQALKGEPSNGSGEIGGRWFEISYTPLRNKTGQVIGVIGVALDVTEQKQMEEEIFKASKIESIGVLAGGIAHDFNNILTAVIGNLALAKMNITPQSTAFQKVMNSEKALLRAQSLTQQLLTFSRGGKPISQPMALDKLLKESTEFIVAGSNVQFEFSIQDDLWPVEADPGQINQVINNLVLNAQQALPEGGTIRIEVINRAIELKDRLPLLPGRYVKMQISDSGTGIAPEVLDKIFDPFFTTKPKGTGLGLTTAYWIVKKHRGHIGIESRPGTGTSVSVYLPKSTAEVSQKTLSEENLVTGQGRILFMDDEEAIRELAAEVLNQLGYAVDCARDGAEAIEFFQKAHSAGEPYAAVILDLVVRTGLGGREAMERLRKINPEARVIVSSGYSNDPVLSDFKNYGFSGWITKPYTVQNLSRVLAEVVVKEGIAD